MAHPGGRPKKYNKKIADEICQWIAQGQSLKSFCCQPGQPSHVAVLRWVREIEEFRNLYTEARRIQREVWADDIIDISDENQNDVRTIEKNGQPVEIVDHDVVNRARLRVDSRKWLLAKLEPRKYGDKQTIEHEIGDSLAELVKSLD